MLARPSFRYVVFALTLLCFSAPSAMAQDPFDDSVIHQWDIVFPPEVTDWYQLLFDNHEDNGLVSTPYTRAASVTVDGVRLENVGVRFKGYSSFFGSGFKKSFKVAFDEFVPGQRFAGLKTFNLNNGLWDPSFSREKMALDLNRAHALGLRAAYARVTVNGTHYGFMLCVEQINKDLLRRAWGDDEDGNLYKAVTFSSYLTYQGEDKEDYKGSYRKKTNEEEDNWADLIALTRTLAQAADGDLMTELETRLDVASYLRNQAVNSVILNHDTYFGSGHNYYVYHADDTGRFQWLNWDLNLAFGLFGSESGNVNLSIDWSDSPRPLFQRLLNNTTGRTFLYSVVRNLVDGEFHPDVTVPKINALRNFIATAVGEDGNFEYNEAQFLNEYSNVLIPMLQGRHSSLMNQLATFGTSPLVINEVLADNERGLTDEAGEAEDWIELVNTSASPLAIGDLFLSDDLARPNQWSLPNVTLAAGERLLIWADNDEDQGSEHANFKLSASGEDLILVAGDGETVLQSVFFGPQRTDVSWGRIPDAAAGGTPVVWRHMVPTPNATNSNNAPPEIQARVQIPSNVVTNQDDLIIQATVIDDVDTSSTVEIQLTVDGVTTTMALLDDGAHDDQAAGDGIYGLNLGMFAEGTLISYWLSAQDSATASSRLPAAAPDEVFSLTVVPAGGEAPVLFINEVLADNSSVNSDEAGEFDDWIELYNPGNDSVSLLGLFLTDDPAVPNKWALPDMTIPAGGFLLVWADNDVDQGPLHAGFKISANGKMVGLYTVDGTEVDILGFGAQATDISFGRSPDGSSTTTTFDNPTPGATNNNVELFADGFETGGLGAWSSFQSGF